MDLPSDSAEESADDEDGHAGRRGDLTARRAQHRKKEQEARLKAQLQRVLSRLDRPMPGVPVHLAAKALGAGTW